LLPVVVVSNSPLPFVSLLPPVLDVSYSPVDFKTAGQIVDDDIAKILVKPMRAGGTWIPMDAMDADDLTTCLSLTRSHVDYICLFLCQ
jgi:hypothetical protein